MILDDEDPRADPLAWLMVEEVILMSRGYSYEDVARMTSVERAQRIAAWNAVEKRREEDMDAMAFFARHMRGVTHG